MSNTNDSFIDEVTEEVRRDRLFLYLRRYGWIGILAIFALVGGTAWSQWQSAKARAEAEALGDGLYAALEVEDAAARAEALAALEVAGPASVVKLMLEAADLAEAGETEAAAEKLAAIAGEARHPRHWRDLAALKRVILLGRTLTPEERIAALAPLATPGAPYRVLALEQEALARLDLGERDAAVAIFKALLADQEAAPTLQLRARQMLLVLGVPLDEV